MSKRAKRQKAQENQGHLRLHFLGANGQVTGSMHFFEYTYQGKAIRFFVDAGLDQERDWINFENRLPKDVKASDLKFGIFSHAHIDHTGYFPRLTKSGFKGPVYCTAPTRDLLGIMLPDSGHIQEEEAKSDVRRCLRKRGSRTNKSSNGAGSNSRQADERACHSDPLYTRRDAEEAVKQIQGVEYNKPIAVADGITLTFANASHMLGAATVTLEMVVGDQKKRICFTGDLGPNGMTLLHDAQPIKSADYLLCESTYGSRLHGKEDRLVVLADVLNKAIERAKQDDPKFGCGVILIPAFAIGRSQTILYDLRQLMAEGRIPIIPTFLDSPSAVQATEIYYRWRVFFNDETQKLLAAGTNIFCPGQGRCAQITDHKLSMKLDEPAKEPIIIISPSGMAQGGRIVHHLEHRLPSEQNTVIFIGYQVRGTLGQKLSNKPKPKRVKIGRKFIPVNAAVETISGYSGHADYASILNWLSRFEQKPSQTFLVHGDKESTVALKAHIENRFGWNVSTPRYRASVDLV